jgi:CheY-like chemotaxis protein
MARVLVIDDDRFVRSALRLLLERMGHQVLEAEDGSEGLNICTSESIDLVITDIYMPILNGLETITTLRRWGLSTPILALSGGVPGHSLDVLMIAIEQGANMTLIKPYALEEMRSAVTKLLTSDHIAAKAPGEDLPAGQHKTPTPREGQS